jgi:hypothetical protein
MLVWVTNVRARNHVTTYPTTGEGYACESNPAELEFRLAFRKLGKTYAYDMPELEICIKDIVSITNVRDYMHLTEAEEDEDDVDDAS